jgi:hypothetical protein
VRPHDGTVPFPVSRPARAPDGTYFEVVASWVVDPFARASAESWWWWRGFRGYWWVFALWNRVRHGGRWSVLVLPTRPSARRGWLPDDREPLLRRDVSGLAAAEVGVDRLVEILETEGL